MSILSSLMLTSLLILHVYSYNPRQLGNDNMCKAKGGVLCVKDELMIIATTVKGISRTSLDIERHIQQTTKVFDTLNRYVNIEMNYTRLHLPINDFHNKFFELNNINKEFLNELFQEAQTAMAYYYNSVDDLLNLRGVFGETTDEWFKKIQNYIRDDIICRYRSMLDVHSQTWKSVHEIGRIQFSRKHRLSPSLLHDVHSVVIVRYLREWMEQITNVIHNLEMKYF